MARILIGKTADGKQITIDLETLIGTRLLVTASSGGGKSETLRRILEEASGKVQCIVIDPEGEFSTLRESYPFVLVGEGGETPADIRSAELVAIRLLELGANAVCDLYEMRPLHNRHEWVKRFLNAMVTAPKNLWHPVIVILDEAHVYSPEKGYGESVANDAVMSMASLGRKRGYCLIAATQRLSKLNKNTVEPLQNFLIGLTTYDDQKRAAQIFKVPPGSPTRDFSLALERLKAGEFFMRGRAFNGDFEQMQVERGKTRPPKTGSAKAGRITPTPAAIKALLPQLADLPHEAEKKQASQDEIKRELREAQKKVVELTKQIEELGRSVGQLEGERQRMADTLRAAQGKAAELVAILSDTPRLDRILKPAPPVQSLRGSTGLSGLQPLEPEKFVVHGDVNQPLEGDTEKMRAGAERMLAALVQWHPQGLTEGQLAAQVGMKRKGGAWGSYKSALRTRGLATQLANLWYATGKGLTYLNSHSPATPQNTQEVLDRWNPKLRRGARTMLAFLISENKPITRAELSAASGIAQAGGSFGSYLSSLVTAGLVETDRENVWANRETLML